MITELDLSYLAARKLLLPSYDSITMALIGCGGTGSFMARGVATVARLLIDKFQKQTSVFFIDPDTVEEKNCYRQNFCPAEIGRSKAESLAFRMGLSWGLEIAAVPSAFVGNALETPGYRQALTILIGCVDNPAARREIQAAAKAYQNGARVWWLDCGNGQSSGQVLVGCGAKRPENPFELPDFCSWLPLPTVRHPELLESEPDENEQADTMRLSCADLAMLDSQGLAINQRVAAEATDYLVQMLLTRDLQKCATYINLVAGSSRSVYITEETVG